MDRMKRLVGVGLVGAFALFAAALVAPGLAATSAQAAQQSRVTLGATNVISGSTTAKIPVRVPAQVRIEKPTAGGRGVSVKGGGKGFVGFALVKKVSAEDHIAFVGGRLENRIGLPPVVMGLGGPQNANPDLKVPAGNYDLYLITDSPGVEVTLRLNGLAGRKDVRPSDKVTAKIANPEADYSSGIVDGAPMNLYSAGSGGRTRGPGLVFDVLWQQRQANVKTLNTFCYYQEKPEAGHPAPYAPGCPSSSDHSFGFFGDGLVNPQPSQSLIYGGGFTVDSSYLGQGFSVTSAGLVTDIAYTALWLSFD